MNYNRYIKYWLLAGVILIFFQIFIGGITRITGSGLSITKWEIVTGILPPLNDSQWEEEFNLYKITPQYKKINQGMEMSRFKFIYFWEYFHRLWARLMGFIFLFPLIFFIYKKWVYKKLLIRLSYVIAAAMLAAVFGWIMVASGLVERPWVNAYKLSLHLGIAIFTLSLLVWLCFDVFIGKDIQRELKLFRKISIYFFIALVLQMFFGAVVSGMRAALYYPSWPDMNGAYLPEVLLDFSNWRISNIVDYDKDALMPALIHVLHRNWAYIVYGLGIYLAIKILRYPLPRLFHVVSIAMIVFLNIQVLLGVLVLINSTDTIPVLFGVMHQAIAIFIFTLAMFYLYVFKRKDKLI